MFDLHLPHVPISPSNPHPRLHLASRSPRRQQLLREHGVTFDADHPGIDDAELLPGRVTPTQWVAALAYLKARAGASKLADQGADPCEPANDATQAPPVFLGADTACVKDGRLIGTPRTADEARDMIRTLRDGAHDVVTGVALIDPSSGQRLLFADTAHVEVGSISDTDIETYIQSGDWQGKAGAYNLSERLAAGWPIRYQGDPATVMGLPMRRLMKCLDRWPAARPPSEPQSDPSFDPTNQGAVA